VSGVADASVDPPALDSLSVNELLAAIAARRPVPGGGAVAGLVHAIGAALGGMVVAYSEGRAALADHAPALAEARAQLAAHRTRALALAAEDARAYAAMNQLWRRPKDDPERLAAMPGAVRAAIAAPRATAELGLDLLATLEGLPGRSNPHLGSDLAIAAILAEAAVRSAIWNVRTNLPMIDVEAERAALADFADLSLKRASEACRRIEQAVAPS
jgi:formiminotetrahydrofolate cyclodeaminase